MPDPPPEDFAEGLAEFPTAELPTLFDPPAAAARDAAVGLPESLRFARRAGRRELFDFLAVANAAKALQRLPEEAESFHVIMAGNFNQWDLVPAVANLAAPATVDELLIATLGFNRGNTDQLVAMLDAGTIRSCVFLYSVYYKAHDPEVADFLTAELERRGHRILAMRCHAKIIGLRLSDGRHLVNESSANLRSCRMIEQATLTHDRALYEFHRGWMLDMLDQADRNGPPK